MAFDLNEFIGAGAGLLDVSLGSTTYSKLTSDKGKTPNRRIGIGDFIADVRIKEEEELRLESPDIPIEDGSIIHDHIIIKPRVITIEGEVANVHIRQDLLSNYASKKLDRASGIITALFPSSKTVSTLTKIKTTISNASRAIREVDNVINGIREVDNIINSDKMGLNSKDRKRVFIDYIHNIWSKGAHIPISTSNYGTHAGMVITSIRLMTDNTSGEAIKYRLTAKEIKLAPALSHLKAPASPNPSPSMANTVAGRINKGLQRGTKKIKKETESLLHSIFG